MMTVQAIGDRRRAFQEQCRSIALKHHRLNPRNPEAAKKAAIDEVRSIIATVLIGIAVRLVTAYIIHWWETRNFDPADQQTVGEPTLNEPLPLEDDGS
jgi:hypothetical protein